MAFYSVALPKKSSCVKVKISEKFSGQNFQSFSRSKIVFSYAIKADWGETGLLIGKIRSDLPFNGYYNDDKKEWWKLEKK